MKTIISRFMKLFFRIFICISAIIAPLVFPAPTPVHAAACTTITINDNVSATNSAAPLTFFYDISPQNDVQGMYVGYTITNTTGTISPDI